MSTEALYVHQANGSINCNVCTVIIQPWKDMRCRQNTHSVDGLENMPREEASHEGLNTV